MLIMGNNGSGTSVSDTIAEIRRAQSLFTEYLDGMPSYAKDNRGTAPPDPRVYHTELTRQIRDLKGYCEREGLPVPDDLIIIEVKQKSLLAKLPRE